MSSDVDSRARVLIEQENRQAKQRAKRRTEQEQASRLSDARSRIKRHDAEIEAERRRREAAAEADALAVELGERAADLQREAEELRQGIENYADLRTRLQDAQRRSGREVGGGRGASTRYVLPNWFRSIFGRHGSLVGVESELAGRVRAVGHGSRALIERDPLASPVTGYDERPGA